MTDFVHLHTHNEFSTFDGFGRACDNVKVISKHGQKAYGLTNHGNVHGLVEHYDACNDAGIKPILGMEAYFVPYLNKVEDENKSFHLVLIAKNNIGYKNLMNLVTVSNDIDVAKRARIDFNMLEKYNEGIVCSSACQLGLIPKLLENNKNEMALKILNKFKNIFGKDFYLEVMPHSMGVQTQTNKNIITLTQKTKTPVIVTSDSHYTLKSHYSTHFLIVDSKAKFEFHGYPDAHLLSSEEVENIWKDNNGNLGNIKEYMKNTVKIADECEVSLEFSNLIPTIDWYKDNFKFLKNTAVKKLKRENKTNKKYIDRLKLELSVIRKKGFVDYFLICHDLMNYAKKHDIATGYGRGSVSGSLVAYALDITKIDPLIHGTLFERFLRPDKKTMPDIDMDFDTARREQVFDYIVSRFPNKSARIISYSRWQVKNTIQDLCKIYGYDKDVEELLKKRIFDLIGYNAESIKYSDLIKDAEIAKVENKSKGLIKHFCNLYGQVNHYSVHASGIAITKNKISDYIGIAKYRNQSVTSYDMASLDRLNILKLDILGLETMAIVHLAEKIAKVSFDEKYLQDKKAIEHFQRAETAGIFQFDSNGGKKMLFEVLPDNFNEIAACNAMNRPGPLKLGVVERYIKGKRGVKQNKRPWDKYAKDTYGEILYQEQTMLICRKVARMSWEDTDKIMKGKLSDSDKNDYKKKFVNGAVKYSKYSKRMAHELFNSMTLYSFNKAHAVAYSLIGFYSMWLYVHHPLPYIYALLRRSTDIDKLKEFEALAIANDIVIWLPHINQSADYTIRKMEDEYIIQKGLSSIKGIGEKTAKIIIENGPYSCEELLVQRVPKRILNSRVLRILREEGCLEFDEDLFSKRVLRYNRKLFSDYEYLRKIDLSKKPKYTNRDYDRLKEDKVFK